MISPDFPYQSRYVTVKGSKMHYIDEGEGAPFLFLHGNPTSSYLWRNVIPHLIPLGRAIAPDLIGMGKSDKPDIDYTFQDHSAHLDEFIEKLGLKNLILVIHDWGSALGFYYAHRNPGNVRGLAFMEALLRPIYTWKQLNVVERFIFKRFRHPVKGHKMIVQKNFFVEKVLRMFTVRKLTSAEMTAYRQPFLDEKSRKPVFAWPNEIPIEGHPERNEKIIASYYEWLEHSEVPKLLLWAKPGAILKERDVAGIESQFKNLKTVFVGKGKHYLQEDCPDEIGRAVAEWAAELVGS
ncbi:MAG: haloalkane dehalogenase [bacterium]